LSNIIEINSLNKSYGVSKKNKKIVYDNFDLTIDSNHHFICLTGPDGAGKSTLLKLLAGVLKKDTGTILLDNKEPNNADESFTENIGYMSQTLGLYGELSVIDNLKLLSGLRGLNIKANFDYLLELLDNVKLLKFKDTLANDLSGGMKQKLALCCAIAPKPNILILDEPTVGVDPVSRAQLWDVINDYVKKANAYCIFSTAYLEEAQESEMVLMLNGGKLLLNGKPSELLGTLKNRTYSFEANNINYAKSLKIALRSTFRDSPTSPILDVCPRLGRIDVLVNENCTSDHLKAYLNSHYPDGVELKERLPILEDIYINEALKDFHGAVNSTTQEQTINNYDKDKKVVVVNEIQKKFGNFTAVRKSSFNVHKGEIFGLLGPNGAGKTTTFRMICALLEPTKGDVKVNGLNLSKAKEDARGTIGYVSQKFSLYRKLSVYQNLEYFGLSYGLEPKQLKARIKELLEDFSLQEWKKVQSENLPFGIQRQLSMACALIHKPKILFIDEATSGADPLARRNFWYLISNLSNSGTCIIVTTHFMEEAEYCDNFLIQDQGQILVIGDPNRICIKDGKRISIQQKFVELIEEFRKKEDL